MSNLVDVQSQVEESQGQCEEIKTRELNKTGQENVLKMNALLNPDSGRGN